ncbi:MAG: 30S ribosomal protein S16 [Pirellulales bacterium]
MKRLGRLHRPFFRICAVDSRSPRDGKVIEELGTYDPMVANTHGRALLNNERVDYWIAVGAQPSDKVNVLIKKYGSSGTHRAQQMAALAELAQKRPVPPAEKPVYVPKKEEPPQPEQPQAAASQPQPEAPAAEPASEAVGQAEPQT